MLIWDIKNKNKKLKPSQKDKGSTKGVLELSNNNIRLYISTLLKISMVLCFVSLIFNINHLFSQLIIQFLSR